MPTRKEIMDLLSDIVEVMEDSEGIAGFHRNGEVAKWGEFEFFEEIQNIWQRMDDGMKDGFCIGSFKEALEACRSELLSVHLQYGDEKNALENSKALRLSTRILEKMMKKNRELLS